MEQAEYPLTVLCRCLRVSPSGFYAWCARPESARTRKDRQLLVLVHESFEKSRQRYGSPRIHANLVEQAVRVSRKRVVRLMRAEGLKARVRKRFKRTTMSDHDQPVAANVLNQEFSADAPNQRWVGDKAEVLVGESGSKLYLAAILDLFSRFVVGWAVSAVNDWHLVIRALEMALIRRGPSTGLLHHSDQGSPGGFNRSSQRLNGEELRWEYRNVVGRHVAQKASPFTDMGPGRRDGSIHSTPNRHRFVDLLPRPAQPLATRHEREHQRSAAPVLPQRHRPV